MVTNPNLRVRLTVDVPPEMERRLRLVAARRDVSLRQYVIEVLEERLAQDMNAELLDLENLMALTVQTDPVLAELWDNERDAAYDQL
jgi:hypothetical protein